ncbi:MAG: hypothetical protein M1825_006452 [Sarcosagium campestre]|nr:MAG: hypothetical protein M1825_006452 [Sarcosagium campestre]
MPERGLRDFIHDPKSTVLGYIAQNIPSENRPGQNIQQPSGQPDRMNGHQRPTDRPTSFPQGQTESGYHNHQFSNGVQEKPGHLSGAQNLPSGHSELSGHGANTQHGFDPQYGVGSGIMPLDQQDLVNDPQRHNFSTSSLHLPGHNGQETTQTGLLGGLASHLHLSHSPSNQNLQQYNDTPNNSFNQPANLTSTVPQLDSRYGTPSSISAGQVQSSMNNAQSQGSMLLNLHQQPMQQQQTDPRLSISPQPGILSQQESFQREQQQQLQLDQQQQQQQQQLMPEKQVRFSGQTLSPQPSRQSSLPTRYDDEQIKFDRDLIPRDLQPQSRSRDDMDLPGRQSQARGVSPPPPSSFPPPRSGPSEPSAPVLYHCMLTDFETLTSAFHSAQSEDPNATAPLSSLANALESLANAIIELRRNRGEEFNYPRAADREILTLWKTQQRQWEDTAVELDGKAGRGGGGRSRRDDRDRRDTGSRSSLYQGDHDRDTRDDRSEGQYRSRMRDASPRRANGPGNGRTSLDERHSR